MRKILTRITTGLLSLSMIFSLVVPAYADYNGSGSGSGSLNGSGSWWVNKQGVRVSIVDKNGNTVLKGSSGGKNYSSIDIVFSNPGTGQYLTGNKFQGMNDGDSFGIGVVLQIKVKHQNEKSPAKFARPKKGATNQTGEKVPHRPR